MCSTEREQSGLQMSSLPAGLKTENVNEKQESGEIVWLLLLLVDL